MIWKVDTSALGVNPPDLRPTGQKMWTTIFRWWNRKFASNLNLKVKRGKHSEKMSYNKPFYFHCIKIGLGKVWTQPKWSTWLVLIPVSLAWRGTEYLSLPLFGMVVHHKVNPPPPLSIWLGFLNSSLLQPIYTSGWREKPCESKVSYQRTQHIDPALLSMLTFIFCY